MFTSIQGSRFGDGFHMTRKEAVLLQKKGIHLISVGISNIIDIPELRAIASYPKLTNAIVNSKSDDALSAALKVTNAFLSG